MQPVDEISSQDTLVIDKNVELNDYNLILDEDVPVLNLHPAQLISQQLRVIAHKPQKQHSKSKVVNN